MNCSGHQRAVCIPHQRTCLLLNRMISPVYVAEQLWPLLHGQTRMIGVDRKQAWALIFPALHEIASECLWSIIPSALLPILRSLRTKPHIPLQCAEVSSASCAAGHLRVLAQIMLVLFQFGDVQLLKICSVACRLWTASFWIRLRSRITSLCPHNLSAEDCHHLLLT